MTFPPLILLITERLLKPNYMQKSLNIVSSMVTRNSRVGIYESQLLGMTGSSTDFDFVGNLFAGEV